MKASELRIGNWVYSTSHKVTCKVIILNFDNELVAGPIPLTEEWLLKFGFGETDKCYYIDELYLKKLDFQPIGEEETDIIFYKLEYVHQLQNLYFALTNKELTLKQ